MRLIISPSNDAWFNMALEEYVFEGLPRDDDYFMLWQNANAVVVGKYQNTIEEIDAAFVKQQGITVVRRLSGGGAMYQDMGNLNFTYVVNQSAAKSLDFSVFIGPVAKALNKMGVKAEQNGRNDIVIDGKKFSGNSQYNKDGRTMHHGTLLFSSDLGMIGRALAVKPDKIQSKGIKSVRSRVTNIADYLPKPASLEEFRRTLVEEMFEASRELTPYRLTEADLAAVERLKTEKYATWEWNYGRSPAYDLRRERRYPFGGVTLDLSVQKGVIQSAAIFGDFFGNGDIACLTAKLEGVPLREDALRAALQSEDVANYIHGMDEGQLIELVLYG